MTRTTGLETTRPRWVTAILAAGVLVAAVLLGAAGGLLLASSTDGRHDTPSAVDIGFAQDMSVHHQQGVAMASWAREFSTDPAIRQLAFDIETGQTEQIGRMHGWLGLWSQPVLPAGRPMSWMNATGHHMQHRAAPMPGMATREELQRLRSLSGRELDTHFLQLMIRHHSGGAPMMREAAQRATVGDVRALASTMLTAQTAEADVMTGMLTERGSAPLPS